MNILDVGNVFLCAPVSRALAGGPYANGQRERFVRAYAKDRFRNAFGSGDLGYSALR